MARLCALAQLDLGHLDLIVLRFVLKRVRIERAILLARAEIARSQFPHDVAAMFQVIGRETTLARIMVEIADLGAEVQRLDRMAAERAEAHGADVQPGRVIRLAALVRSHMHARALRRVGVRIDGMAQCLIFFGIDVQFGAERMRILLLLRACVDERAGHAVERAAFQRAFHDIAAQERAKIFEQPAETGGQRIIAAQRMLGLRQIPDRDQQQRREQNERPEEAW